MSGRRLPALETLRLAQVAIPFALIYWTSNLLTSLRTDIGEGVFAWERAIPFVQLSIVPYLSIFALFAVSFFACRNRDDLERHCARLLLALLISVVCYAFFPLRFDFQRPEPVGPTSELFRWLWSVDLPFNRAPSLHISVLVILWSRFLSVMRARWRWVLHAWMTAIAFSVLTTYQHHVIDVASGLVVGGICLLLPAAWLRRLHGRHGAIEAAEPRPARRIRGRDVRKRAHLPYPLRAVLARKPFGA